jgi:hypothetical protein
MITHHARRPALFKAIPLFFVAALTAGCHNGSDPDLNQVAATLRMISNVQCSGSRITIDLAAAGGEFAGARGARAAIAENCGLAADLVEAGCEFDIQQDGDELQLTVSRCNIPADSDVVTCTFTDTDGDLLANATTALCGCQCQDNCDATPEVCVVTEEGSNCAIFDKRSARGIAEGVCEITFGVPETEMIGSLQYDVDYSGAAGGFVGADSTVSCSAIVAGFPAFNDIEAESKLSTAIITLSAFSTPTNVARCEFAVDGSTAPMAGDFAITVTDAADGSASTLDPLPSVEITGIECNLPMGSTTTIPDTTTTTSTSTTTSTTTTTTMGGPTTWECDAVFKVTSTHAAIGSLQYDTNYSKTGGDFRGESNAVECSAIVSGFPAFNDMDAEKTLGTAIITLSAFSAPADVARCTFDVVSETEPTSDGFLITVVDAADGGAVTLDPLPDMAISLECTGTGVSTTTTSTTSTTTTTDTTMSTTTTTLGGGGVNIYECSAIFSLDSTHASVGSLQFDVDYSDFNGEGFVGSDDDVECTTAINGFPAFNDIEAQKKLSAAIITLSAFSSPTDVTTCRFRANGLEPPSASDFGITIVDAATGSGAALENPMMGSRIVGCEIIGMITTTTTTTSTTTTTTLGEQTYIFTVAINDADDEFGEIRFNVSPNGDGVIGNCDVDDFDGTVDEDGMGGLDFCVFSVEGQTSTSPLVGCEITSSGEPSLSSSVESARDPELNPTNPDILIDISGLE